MALDGARAPCHPLRQQSLGPVFVRKPRSNNLSTPDIVRLENVGLRYGPGPEVLRDVSLALPQGSFHFLTGASGAGKSSLLRLMFLGLRPTRGRVTIFGHDIARTRRQQLPALRRRV